MAEGPLVIIFEMIIFLIRNSFTTVLELFSLFGRFIGSLALMTSAGGGLGIILAVILLAVIGLFAVKFFFGSAKRVFLLGLAGIAIILFILLGLSAL